MSGASKFDRGFGKGDVIEIDAGSKAAQAPEFYGCEADKLKARGLRWFWPGMVVFGGLTFVIGDPDAGKSTFLADLIGRVTRGGEFPDGEKAPRVKVLYYTVEENIRGALIPRLIAAGANRARVRIITAQPVAGASERGGLDPLPEGARQIRTALHRFGARVVILDPVSDYFAAGADTNAEVAVRNALKPLARLAEETDTAIICVRHLNKKSEAQALYRMLGSNAFIQMPRAILQIDRDPELEHGRVLRCIKNNYAVKPAPLRFKLVSGRKGIVRVEWGGRIDKEAEEAIVDAAGVTPTKLEEARRQICALLADGPADARSVETAMRSLGVADRTRFRAYRAVGVEKQAVRDEKSGEIVKWMLSLPSSGR